ncbi:DUF664 domain-containing protein [Actinospica durhamensis]|uniref:DUF664 domain-containing protein n=1 Tax=Actinospica durhamensis TaxID=1508375 RepID=A0A941F1B6_9ACTN|nr:DinB family protein [Actinospica durhamensis]MBR7839029.1 DUF664 domain-containing protein [Actinospica durhamensis]
MVWKVPAATEVEGPLYGDEHAMLHGFLDHHRARFLVTCAGLNAEQLARRACPPSNLSMLGLARHLADSERVWFRRRFGGQRVEPHFAPAPRRTWLLRRLGGLGGEDIEPRHAPSEHRDGAFEHAEAAHAEHDWAVLLTEQQAARDAVARLPLDAQYHTESYGEVTLRWVLIHMAAEYASHSGHAELLRERIKGRTRTAAAPRTPRAGGAERGAEGSGGTGARTGGGRAKAADSKTAGTKTAGSKAPGPKTAGAKTGTAKTGASGGGAMTGGGGTRGTGDSSTTRRARPTKSATTPKTSTGTATPNLNPKSKPKSNPKSNPKPTPKRSSTGTAEP